MRRFLLVAVAFSVVLTASAELEWIDGTKLPIEGRATGAVDHYYDRLPAGLPVAICENVRELKHHTSGMQFRFTTTSPVLSFRWTPYYDAAVKSLPGCLYGSLGMAHMPATGTSGIDVYVQTKAGEWEYRRTGFIYAGENGSVSTGRVDGVHVTPGTPICVNLPLYNGIRTFELGVVPGSKISPLPPRKSGVTKPVVFYGTSITQGGCASRPGLGFVNIIGRELDVPVLNLGFSGGGRMEIEMAEQLAKVEASCYVLDALWNMNPDTLVAERYEPFVRRLRKLRPGVPIVLAEQSCLWSDQPSAKDRVVRKVHDRLKAEGWKGLVLLPKKEMYVGLDGTVDGCHANDLGMRTMAEAFGKAVRQALMLKEN